MEIYFREYTGNPKCLPLEKCVHLYSRELSVYFYRHKALHILIAISGNHSKMNYICTSFFSTIFWALENIFVFFLLKIFISLFTQHIGMIENLRSKIQKTSEI